MFTQKMCNKGWVGLTCRIFRGRELMNQSSKVSKRQVFQTADKTHSGEADLSCWEKQNSHQDPRPEVDS
jgi:hypothetical protein